MKKADLLADAHKALNGQFSKDEVRTILDTVLNEIGAGLRRDGRVQISGFGTFENRVRKARVGRNPKTGEAMPLAQSVSVGFRASTELKDAISAEHATVPASAPAPALSAAHPRGAAAAAAEATA
ncbi:MAG: integration host factor subunit beta [Planctomycetes bacterium]|nr:integration host factor subunit beta [Planctomycetota bacterium]